MLEPNRKGSQDPSNIPDEVVPWPLEGKKEQLSLPPRREIAILPKRGGLPNEEFDQNGTHISFKG